MFSILKNIYCQQVLYWFCRVFKSYNQYLSVRINRYKCNKKNFQHCFILYEFNEYKTIKMRPFINRCPSNGSNSTTFLRPKRYAGKGLCSYTSLQWKATKEVSWGFSSGNIILHSIVSSGLLFNCSKFRVSAFQLYAYPYTFETI